MPLSKFQFCFLLAGPEVLFCSQLRSLKSILEVVEGANATTADPYQMKPKQEFPSPLKLKDSRQGDSEGM